MDLQILNLFQYPPVTVVPLRSHDFTGLGFNICGNMRDGIYVKDVLHRGPASESGRIMPGISISFQISGRLLCSEQLNCAVWFQLNMFLTIARIEAVHILNVSVSTPIFRQLLPERRRHFEKKNCQRISSFFKFIYPKQNLYLVCCVFMGQCLFEIFVQIAFKNHLNDFVPYLQYS